MARGNFRRAAAVLAEAWLGGWEVDFAAALLPVDRGGAYAVQDEMAGRLASGSGHAVVGWKVGATSPGVQRAEGYDGPIPGRIFGSTVYEDGSVVAAERCRQGRVEAEVGFRFAAAPVMTGGEFGREGLAEIVTAVPAFDITSTRYTAACRAKWDSRQKMLAGIADNGNGGAIVLGAECRDWTLLDLMRLRVALRVNGGTPAPNLLGTWRGDPLDALVWTVSHVYERGLAIAAGDVVLTGSLTEPQPVKPGDRVECEMPGLGSLSCQVSLA